MNKKEKIIVISLLLLKLLLIVFTGTHADEGYYWDWTRFLSVGYFDHPPMVAWLIKAFQPLFGMGTLAIKASAAVTTIFTFFFIYKSSILVVQPQKKFTNALIVTSMLFATPLFAILTSIMTPDVPLFMFWAISLYLGIKIIDSKETKIQDWLLLSVATALGMYSKYTFILFFPSFAIALIIYRRDLLTTIYPYLTLIIAIIIGIPHLVWNIEYNFPALTFQVDHGLGSSQYHISYVWEYITAQFALFNPLLSIALGIAIVTIIKNYKQSAKLGFILVTVLLPLLFFGYASLKKRGNANWPAMAFIGGIILIVWLYNNNSEKIKKYIKTSIIIGVVLTSIITIQMIQPIIPIQSVVNELFGWQDFANDIDSSIENSKYHDLQRFVNSYQMAGILGLYSKDHPRYYALNIMSRPDHYSLLKERDERIQGRSIFITELDNHGNIPSFLKDAFKSINIIDTVQLIQGKKIKKYGIFVVSGIKKEALH